jgi:hypothetical protein
MILRPVGAGHIGSTEEPAAPESTARCADAYTARRMPGGWVDNDCGIQSRRSPKVRASPSVNWVDGRGFCGSGR